MSSSLKFISRPLNRNDYSMQSSMEFLKLKKASHGQMYIKKSSLKFSCKILWFNEYYNIFFVLPIKFSFYLIPKYVSVLFQKVFLSDLAKLNQNPKIPLKCWICCNQIYLFCLIIHLSPYYFTTLTLKMCSNMSKHYSTHSPKTNRQYNLIWSVFLNQIESNNFAQITKQVRSLHFNIALDINKVQKINVEGCQIANA